MIKAHQQMRSSTLNLIVSENLMSPATLAALSTDIACRYTNPHKEYRGTLYIDKIMAYNYPAVTDKESLIRS